VIWQVDFLPSPPHLSVTSEQTPRRYTSIGRIASGGTMSSALIVVDPDIQSGAPVFAGTRVPVQNLFDYLEEGDSLDVFLKQFPSVTREQAVAVLEKARVSLLAAAPPAC
jgi:uncharacterized protein (DUF433 family)